MALLKATKFVLIDKCRSRQRSIKRVFYFNIYLKFQKFY